MPSLIRWEPMDDLVNLRNTVNRLIEESLGRTRPFKPFQFEGSPAMDVYETSDTVVVQVSLPGVKSQDIDIAMKGDMLTIKGKMEEAQEIDQECYICRERHFGSFSRSVRLPGDLDPDQASAQFQDGVLKLTIPKKEEAKPKVIEIKAQKE